MFSIISTTGTTRQLLCISMPSNMLRVVPLGLPSQLHTSSPDLRLVGLQVALLVLPIADSVPGDDTLDARDMDRSALDNISGPNYTQTMLDDFVDIARMLMIVQWISDQVGG